MKAFSLIILSALLVFTNTSVATAAESLRYDAPISRSSLERLKQFTSAAMESTLDAYDVAGTDLNDDGLDEFILKSKTCDQKCRFAVVAENNRKIIPLVSIEAANVVLGNEFEHGVRNLLVFENPNNDFDYVLYTWHPLSSTYKKAGL